MQDCPAAAASPENADLIGFASLNIDFPGGLIGIADDDEWFLWLPEPEDFLVNTLFAEIEQGFIAGQVFGGRGEG